MRRRAGSGPFAGGPPRLGTERLVLRELTPNDADAVFAHASDPEVTRYVTWETHRSPEDSRAFLELAASRYEGGGGPPSWGIVYRGDGRLVGTCGFVQHEPIHARAEVGCVLHRAYWGRGLAAEALRAMISFGFEKMRLNRIEARCIAENTAAARIMQKAGMTREGTLRQRELVKGEYRDMEVYAILRREYGGG